MDNIFYMKTLSEIGGTESFFYYLARKYQKKDITFIVETGNIRQINRLRKYARVIIWDGKERFTCKRLYCNYFIDIIDHVDAEEYIQIIHTDYLEQRKNLGMIFIPNPKITRYIGVSKIVCEHFKEVTGLDIELCYNPIYIEKPKRILNLISATRLTNEKGRERMQKLADLLDKEEIPFIWLVFTNDSKGINNKNIIYMRTKMDITNYIANSDYLVQLSDNGEGYGYTPAEALSVGTPVIVTPCDAFKEIGVKDGYNGFIVPFDMNNIDIHKIYESKLEFEYHTPKDRWNIILGKKQSNYVSDFDKYCIVRVLKEIDHYWDKEQERTIRYNDGEYKVNKHRARELVDAGVCEIIKEL